MQLIIHLSCILALQCYQRFENFVFLRQNGNVRDESFLKRKVAF
jgi:hypothetical protein